jgi:predicted phage terminase large subunit-like protein
LIINGDLINELYNSPLESSTLLKTSFKLFIKVFHFYLYRKDFIFKGFHNEIMKALENIVFGYNVKNICVNIPPRFGKSQLVKYFIAWTYAINRSCNNIYTSYSDDLVLKFSSEIKNIIECDLHKVLFNLKIQHNSSSKAIWKILDGGETRASSMGGAITGFGAGTIGDGYGGALFIDDPLKVEDGRSDARRSTCINFYEDTLKSRLNNKNTPIILIMQRIHVNDIVGYIKENEPNDWDFITCKIWDEETNELLWNEKFSLEACKQMKEQNPYKFYSQYQQEPIVQGGNLIKIEWFRYYDRLPKLRSLRIYADTAMTQNTTSDYTVFQLWGKDIHDTNSNYYLIDQARGRWDADQLLNQAQAFYNNANTIQKGLICNAFCVEEKMNGIVLLQQLKNRKIPVIELKANKDKIQRANDALPTIASGFVYLPNGAHFLNGYLAEIQAFPDGEHDDQLDATTYAINDSKLMFSLKNVL